MATFWSLRCGYSRQFFSLAPYLLLAYNEINSPTVSYLLWMNSDHVTLNDNMHHHHHPPTRTFRSVKTSARHDEVSSEYQFCNWAQGGTTWRAHRERERASLAPSRHVCHPHTNTHTAQADAMAHTRLFACLRSVSQPLLEMRALALAAITSHAAQWPRPRQRRVTQVESHNSVFTSFLQRYILSARASWSYHVFTRVSLYAL